MYRILLVDDDQNIVDGLGSIIKQNFENIFAIPVPAMEVML